MSRIDASKGVGVLLGGAAGGAGARSGLGAVGSAGAGGVPASEKWEDMTIESVPLMRIFEGKPLDPGEEEYPAGIEPPSLKMAIKKSRAAAGQAIALVIGLTGAGKSTTINYLLGHELEEGETPTGDPCMTIASSGGESSKPVAQMGASANSCTLCPETFFVASAAGRPDLYVADCPGFKDTRPLGRIIASYSTDMLLKSAGQVKGLILVIDDSSLSGRASNFRELVQVMISILKTETPEQLAKVAESTVRIYNPKNVKPKKPEQILKKLGEISAAVKSELDALKARFTMGERGKDFSETLVETEVRLQILQLMEKVVSGGRMLTADFQDAGKMRAALLHLLNVFAPIPKSYLSFEQLSSAQMKMTQAIIKMAEHANELAQSEDQLKNEIGEIESLHIPRLQRQIASAREQITLLSSESEGSLAALEKSRADFEKSIVSNKTTLEQRKSEHKKLAAEVASLRSQLSKLDNDDMVSCFRHEYNVTHAGSLARATTGGVALLAGLGLATAASILTLGIGAGAAFKTLDSTIDYIATKNITYSGVPYKTVKLSEGLRGDVVKDSPSEGEYCFSLNEVGSSNGLHSIELFTEKRLMPGNVGKIKELKNQLGTAGVGGKLNALAGLERQITELAAEIASLERLVSSTSSRREETKLDIQNRVKDLEGQVVNYQGQIAEYNSAVLPHKKAQLGAMQAEFEKYKDYFILAQHIAQVLRLGANPQLSITVADFTSNLAKKGVAVTSELKMDTDPTPATLTKTGSSRFSLFGGAAAIGERLAGALAPPFVTSSAPGLGGKGLFG